MHLVLAAIVATTAGGDAVTIDGVPQYEYVDAMFEAVRLAIAQRGDVYDATYIQGISGMAFRIAGPCPCAPTCSMGMGTEALAELVGYEVERLCLGMDESDFKHSVAEVVERVEEEIRAGRPVPVWHAFTNAEWDLVTGFDDERGEFVGWGSWHHGEGDDYARAPQDRMEEAVHFCPAYGALIIGEKTGEFDARAAELDAIEEAIRHCHAPKDPLLLHAEEHGHETPFRLREGKVCYDVWINTFRNNPQYVPNGPTDKYPLGVYSSTRQAAAPFLRQIAPNYPEARELLLKAAEHFEVDAAALERLRQELMGWEAGWDEPDPTKAARAVELLTTARKAYGKGMKAMERGLEAIGPERCARAHVRAVVLRGEGSAKVKDVRSLDWEKGRDCTLMGSLAEALRHTDSMHTYSDLMGLSGMALRLRYSNGDTKTEWCPSCTVAEMPDEQNLLAKQIGWTLPAEWSEPEGRDNEALAARLAAEIGAGRCVVGYPGNWNMALIFGYEDAGKTLLVNDYMDTARPGRDYMVTHKSARVPIEKVGPLLTFLGEQKQPPPARKALRRALKVALANWKREKHDGGLPDREYWYGEAAWQAWLGDLEGFGELDEESQVSFRGLSPWVYTQLFDARKAAAHFLKDWSCVAGDEAKGAMLRAAALYQEEVDTLDTLLPAQRERHEAIESDEVGNWADDDRAREAEVLRQAFELDRRAMGEVETAVERLD